MSLEAPTPESQAKSSLMRNLRDAAESGDLQPARQAFRGRQIKPKQYEALVRTSRGQGLTDLTRDFNYEELRKVYEVATPEEKKLLESRLRRAAAKAKRQTRMVSSTPLPFFMRWAGRDEQNLGLLRQSAE